MASRGAATNRHVRGLRNRARQGSVLAGAASFHFQNASARVDLMTLARQQLLASF